VSILQNIMFFRSVSSVIKNNDLREVVVTDTFLFLSTLFIQSTDPILYRNNAYVNSFFRVLYSFYHHRRTTVLNPGI